MAAMHASTAALHLIVDGLKKILPVPENFVVSPLLRSWRTCRLIVCIKVPLFHPTHRRVKVLRVYRITDKNKGPGPPTGRRLSSQPEDSRKRIHDLRAGDVIRDMRLLEEFVQDARYAIRGMRRAPGFTAVAVLTLALGIGANAGIFSVLFGVWLSPVQYAQAGRLVDLSTQQLSGHRFKGGTSWSNLEDWKAQTVLVEAFGTHQYARQLNVTGIGEAEEIIGHRVSAGLFELLGANPAIGHWMDAAADRASGPRQTLISYAWWRQRFGDDPNVVSRRIFLDGEAFTIAGVMPSGFEFPPMGSAAYRPVMWTSLNLSAEQERARDGHSLGVLARLKGGVSISRAQAEMDTIAARLSKAYPEEDGGWGIKVTRLNNVRQLEEVRPALVLLMAAASLVLLIACANIANLLVARAAGRDREMAVRRALGVTRRRLARQLLTESGMLALAGGSAGVFLAYWGMPLLRSALPASMPRANQVGLNNVVLLFAAAVSMLTGLVFGLIPAVRQGGSSSLAPAGRAAMAHNRTARVLVAAEVALALVLLVDAGMLVDSLWRASHVDLGFRKEHVLTVRFQLSKRSYPNGRLVRAFREELLRRVDALPGVQSAGTVSSLPMGMIGQGTDFEVEGRPETAKEKPFASYSNVSAGYLQAMGIPLLSGRYFGESDGPMAPPVAIVSESLARAWWPGAGALGRRIRFDEKWFTIAGIAKDVRQSSPERSAVGQIYALNHQLSLESQGAAMGRFNVLAIRTASDPGAIAAAVRRAVAEIDKNQPVAEVTTMDQVVRSKLESRRLNTLLLAVFAGLAVALAVVGVFGVGAYAVARRTKEIGIRMAIGATPGSVMLMVARETLLLALAGTAAGLGGTVATSRLLAGFLYGVRPVEPAILAAMAMTLVAAVVVSGLFPARRAMRVDPMVALRED
jgi:putative ABC transport system permease protein